MQVIRPLLILCLVLTSFALGSARGQARIGDQVVLCSGEAVVLVYGPDGAPVESPYYCPDMVLSMLAATVLPDPSALPEPTAFAAYFTELHLGLAEAAQVAPQARDPPLVSIT
ncbi:hypothetical protein FNJ84_15945 [Paracoccus sp. M683]|uniref:hypothetical protein n=1 Tax=Paracoccus sp. M683 TaxID=2594268 RepID=UPI00117C7D46|nr:hypothetical protein [Paracoccus sp. M683]TRW95477.1 hypothetical protein FNJ84_15945 [Paracoccus sp. M683]